MKAILRKGVAACAAVLMGANVMAQSFDLTKEFQGGLEEDFFEGGVVSSALTKDGNPRLVIMEGTEGNGENRDENGNYTYTYTMDKLSILNNNLETEKEFTSGPLFEEYVDITARSAAKTLRVESVDTLYSGEEALVIFYDSFEAWFADEDGQWRGHSYNDLLDMYLGTEDEWRIEYRINNYIAEEYDVDTTFLGERFLFRSYYVKESDYFDWGTKYPEQGWIYKDHDDICCVRFNYVPDEFEEISRYNSSVYSAYYKAEMYYVDFAVDMTANGVISQNLFNDDDKYEFLLPELAVWERSSYSEWSGTQTTEYDYAPIGYKIVSEDGTVLHRLIINEGKDKDMRCYAYVTSLGDKNYLMVYSYKRVDGSSDYYYTNEVTRFYEIKKDGSGIQKVREMRGGMNIRPTVANRDEQITITLNDENSNVARELVVTGVNGQLVGRRDIPVGENSVQIPASMLRSGMYNFTLQQKGQVVDNGKVIVK